jgi:hypothetical protein
MQEKTNMSSRQCEHATKSGAHCRANAVSGSTTCFVHNEALAERERPRADTAAKISDAVLGPDSPRISLRSESNALDLTDQLFEFLLRDGADPKVINSAVGLLNFWQRAYSTEILERRIVALEQAQNTGPQRSPDRIEGAEQFGARGKKS